MVCAPSPRRLLVEMDRLTTVCRTARCVVAAAAVALLTVGGQANPSLAALTTTPPLSVASVQPAPGEVVGVAQPIVITFTQQVADRVAAERALTITASPRPSGQVARVMPASMGKPSRPTPVGSYSVLEKDRSVEMDSRTIGIPLSSPEGYDIIAQYAERITSSGVYVHSAPWSVDSQGNANVSHGCINLSPDNAAWYYDVVHVGDSVIVQP